MNYSINDAAELAVSKKIIKLDSQFTPDNKINYNEIKFE